MIANALLRVGTTGTLIAVQLDITALEHHRPNAFVIGFALAVQAIVEMLFAPIFARYADRLGRKLFLVLGPLLGAIGTVLVAFSVHPLQIVSIRVFEGLGAAAFVPTALGIMALQTQNDQAIRARASSAFEGSTLMGIAGGYIVGAFAFHALHRQAFFILAALYCLAALICYLRIPYIVPMQISPLSVIRKAIWGPGPIKSFIPAWLCVNTVLGAWTSQTASLLNRSPNPRQTLVHGFDERIIGLILLASALLLVLGIIFWAPVLRRIGPPRTMQLAIPGAFLMCLALLAMNHLPLRFSYLFLPLVILGILVVAGFAPAAVAYLADCSEALAADRASLMAFYTVSLAGGSTLGALLGGVVIRLALADGLIFLSFALAAVAYWSLRPVVTLAKELPISTHSAL